MVDSSLFDSNIIRLEQQAQYLILLCDNDSVIVYEWTSRRLVQVLQNYVEAACTMTTGEKQVVVGSRDGTLKVSSYD